MIYRHDVKSAAIVAERNIKQEQLKEGRLPFFEKVAQESDVKNFQSSVPLASLVKGRVVISFGEGETKNSMPVESPEAASITSTTGQLEWFRTPKGYFTINTNGTQGMVGFSSGKKLDFDDFTLKTPNEFAIILLHSNLKDKDIASSKSIIVTTIARARNTGMQYNDKKDELLELGTAPILLEPVVLELTLKKRKNLQVYILDHSGNRTGEKIPLNKGSIILDGRKYKAIYYELAEE
ncbi:hypothetical protein [Flavitalea sp.]|nr:hypothetical protein [Flavitalea sp.]